MQIFFKIFLFAVYFMFWRFFAIAQDDKASRGTMKREG